MTRRNRRRKAGVGGILTDAELGGTTFPVSLTVQPDGSPGYVVGYVVVAVASVVESPTHGYPVCTTDDVSVPPNATGTDGDAELTTGAAAAAVDAAALKPEGP